MNAKLDKGLGLGTFSFANPFTPIDEREATKIIHSFIELGGRYIDTAPTYAFGETEKLVGRALKSSGVDRSRYFIGSMCGYVLDENGQYKVSGKYNDVVEDCEASLQRLQLEYLDVYMSHLPDPNTPFEETMSALVDLKKQGKIRSIGVSNVSLEQLKEYNKDELVSFVENRFSLLNRNLSPDFISYCEQQNIKLIVFQVIERGLLTNKVMDGIALRDGDLRNKKPEFVPEVRERIGQWVRKYLKPIADNLGISVSVLALWWALQQPAIHICLNGATSETQLRSNYRAMTIGSSPEILERVESSYQAIEQQLQEEFSRNVREFMGLAQYNIYKGSSPSGSR